MLLDSNLENAYFEAYRIACEKLPKLSIEEVCQNTKATFHKTSNAYILKYFDGEYMIDLQSGAVSLKDAPNEVTTTEKVLILHYLTNSQPFPLTGRNISFLEIPGGGAIYYSTFKKRTIDPFVKTFSNNIPAFLGAASALSGHSDKLGDASATIFAFPLVPITYVLWQGEDSDTDTPAIASSGTILFDASVSHFLPVEDIVLTTSFGLRKLMGR